MCISGQVRSSEESLTRFIKTVISLSQSPDTSQFTDPEPQNEGEAGPPMECAQLSLLPACPKGTCGLLQGGWFGMEVTGSSESTGRSSNPC